MMLPNRIFTRSKARGSRFFDDIINLFLLFDLLLLLQVADLFLSSGLILPESLDTKLNCGSHCLVKHVSLV